MNEAMNDQDVNLRPFPSPQITKKAYGTATTISLSGFFNEKRQKNARSGPKNDDFEQSNDLSQFFMAYSDSSPQN